jgi:hypothetical protein
MMKWAVDSEFMRFYDPEGECGRFVEPLRGQCHL